MAVTDQQLNSECLSLEQVGTQFQGWMIDHEACVGQERVGLDKEMRRATLQARRLQEAVQRPMCAGVFGPSQSGKSYLISALARKGTAPLMAAFGDQAVDFIRDINPEGGRESTGLVTRFTIHGSPTPPGAPVRMRLLTQTDIVKIIANTYYSDCDHSEDPIPTQAQLNDIIETIAVAALPAPIDSLTADDVHDLQTYFERYFKGCERIRLLRHGFWERAAALAPRLRIQDRARLLGLLWGNVESFDALYGELYAGLQQLDFAADAYAGLEALLPRESSLIDVRSLQGLGNVSSDRLNMLAANGSRASLPRSTITALVAELRIVIRDQPWDFFEHTDLLDFPGARSREQIKDLPRFLETPDALQNLFLRGKVAYLFERYCNQQELTSMLLCIGPSNQEVKTLPAMVYDWIATTHGVTPAQRSQQPTALFLVLTKFDMEFEEKAGERAPESRWITRLESSLINFFGKQHDWPRHWDEAGCFRNSFWLRNPNFKAKNIFDYDEDGHELGIRASERKRIEAFQQAFLADTTANRYFCDPQQAWEAAFGLNDGGVTYLAESLRPLCNPDLKRRQIAGQLERLRQQMVEHMRPYYLSGNPEHELANRVAASQPVAAQLIECAGEQHFGELLQALQVESDGLEDIYYRIETRLPSDTETQGMSSIGTTVDRARMQQLLGLTGGTPEPQPEADIPQDDAALFAAETLAEWMQDLQSLAADAARCDYFRLPQTIMATFVQEIIAGAKRLDIEAEIARTVREVIGFRMRFQQIVALPARLSANLINNYINYLGYDAIAITERPQLPMNDGPRAIFPPRRIPRNGPELGEQQARYDQDFYTDWIRAFLDLVERNARFQGGVDVDLTANERLGQMLTQLGVPHD